ncbi:MAG: RluA family pseudouridine synthase [Nitrospirae bacterium]|nr:RluA family pseudouridine synthase [Nitrospirota bacterium]
MRKPAIYNVQREDASIRLDRFVSAKSGLSRSQVQKLIKKGLILVNSLPEKANYTVRTGDVIELKLIEEVPLSLIPEDIPVDILWEDEHIVVVDKQPGMVVYPAAGHRSGTLLNALSYRYKLPLSGGPLRPGVVHRLDKDTSGAIVVAKTDEAYAGLSRQFRERGVEKHYIALLYGSLPDDRGEIRALIGRSRADRKKMSTRTRRGKEAITEFNVIERLGSACLVDVKIITGRTHQIRVHFSSTGHPVLGDKTYGKKRAINLGKKIITFERQMLHAHSLRFKHPIDGRLLEFKAPMPEDMKAAIKELR